MVDWIFWLLLSMFAGFALPFMDTGPAETSVVEPAEPPLTVEVSPAVPGTAPEGHTPALGPAHRQWLDRDPLIPCGTIEAGGPGTLHWRENPAFDCLRQSAEHGVTGEVEIRFHDEGQLVRQWHRVTADSLLEIYTERTFDRWSWIQCPLPDEITDGCVDAEWTLTTP